MEDFEASMQGIYSESVNDFTRDESPMVYKPAEEIIANIAVIVSNIETAFLKYPNIESTILIFTIIMDWSQYLIIISPM